MRGAVGRTLTDRVQGNRSAHLTCDVRRRAVAPQPHTDEQAPHPVARRGSPVHGHRCGGPRLSRSSCAGSDARRGAPKESRMVPPNRIMLVRSEARGARPLGFTSTAAVTHRRRSPGFRSLDNCPEVSGRQSCAARHCITSMPVVSSSTRASATGLALWSPASCGCTCIPAKATRWRPPTYARVKRLASRRWLGSTANWSSTSTSPTTLPASTTRAGAARWRRRRTGCR